VAEIDSFATALFEQAKRFLEKAHDTADRDARQSFCHAALLLGVCALEAHINAVAEELTIRRGLSILDESILKEQDYSLEKGTFELKPRLRMYRLEDRILFMFKRFTKEASITNAPWWSGVKSGVDLRNSIVHPKSAATVSEAAVRRALESELECLNALYRALYKKKYPGYGRGLSSSLTF
jgi:hypothetical protein